MDKKARIKEIEQSMLNIDALTLEQIEVLQIEYNELTKDEYCSLTKEDLISPELFEKLLKLKDGFERTQAETMCINRARELKIVNDFNKNYKAYKIKLAQENVNTFGMKTDFPEQPITLACGEWIANAFGVKRNKLNMNNGNVSTEVASPIPILPVEILENMDTGIEKLKLAYYKKGWKSLICERSKTASSSKIIELADKGIEVNSENSKLLVSYLADCISMNLYTLPRYKAISRLGWVENQFMPYDSDIKFDGEKENKYLFEAIEQAGSYDRWVEYMTPLRRNLYFRLQMAASFSSPLIEKVNALPFVFHLWGGTGSGKTVGLMAAMSIWGSPKMGKMVRTMNMTANSMLATAAFLCNLPFAGDELQTIKNRWEGYDNLIMKITEGIDRGRMSYDKINELKTWKCSFLFTGEEPCTKASSGGGTKNRVIEIECVDKVVDNGNEVVNFLNDNYGYAGIEFIKGIRKENLLKQYTEIFNGLITSVDTTEKQAMAMALILLADKLACKYIFIQDADLKISDVAEFLSSAKEVDIAERAYEFVINMIARNSTKFPDPTNEYYGGEVWGRFEPDAVLINKDVLIKEMSAEGFEFEAVKNKWMDKGYVIKNKRGRSVHQTHCFGVKANYIKIKLKSDENEDENRF